MILLVAALCDAATDYGGKLNILGTFDTIFAGQLPVVHPGCAVALRMSFNKAEEGRHEVRIDVVNDDGAPVGPPMEVDLQIEVPDEIEAVSRNVIINIQNWQFTSEGNFALNVSVDRRHQTSIPLRVVLAQHGSGQLQAIHQQAMDELDDFLKNDLPDGDEEDFDDDPAEDEEDEEEDFDDDPGGDEEGGREGGDRGR